MALPFFNVFVGSRSGLLKGVNTNKDTWINVNSLDEMKKENEICSMCWANLEETQICLGLQNGKIKMFDLKYGNFEVCKEMTEESSVRSLARYDESFLLALESGSVILWKNKEEHKVIFEAGNNLHKMRQNPNQPSIIATGGKENDLKVWDLNRGEEPIFKARNVPDDYLDLRVPIWVMDMQFIPDTKQIVTCTGHHHVRIYDRSASNRRPVMNMEFDEYPLTSLSLTSNSNSVVVGNTQGKMALIDLRKGQMVHLFRGCSGSIRFIHCHETQPLVYSCGLDRFLRVHDLNNKTLLHKIYLKSQLNCLLSTTLEDVKEEEDEENIDIKDETIEEQLDDDVEHIWQNMKHVDEKKRKKVTFAVDVDYQKNKKRK